MKTQTIDFDVDVMTDGGNVAECSNLVAVSGGGVRGLTVAPPLVAVRQGRLRPLATYYDGSGRAHLLFQQRREGESPRLAVESQGRWLEVADGEARCAIARRDGFVVMTSEGPLNLTVGVDGEWRSSGLAELSPEIVVTAEAVGTISEQTAAVTLKDVDFDRTSPQIGSAGLKTLGKELCDAYSRLAALAADGGLWLQPVAVRWHLLDSAGERAYSSAPIVAGCGWQCVGTMSADCVKGADTLDVPSLRMTAEPYRLSLSVDPGNAARLIASGIAAIEVTATAQIHPVDSRSDVAWRLVRQSTSVPVLTVALPGATDRFSSRNARRAEMLCRMMAFRDSAETRIGIVRLDADGCESTLSRTDAPTLDEETKNIDSLLSKSPDRQSGRASTLLQSILSPNCFTAAAAAVSGDTVVWGDVTPVVPTSLSVSDICAEFIEEDWGGVLEVTYGGGATRRFALSGTMCPTAWGAAVSYPDASAVGLTLYVRRSAGGVYRGTRRLTPLADGSRAIALDSGLSTEELDLWQGEMPEADGADVADGRCPGAIVTARLAAPTVALAAVECCHSPIRRLIPAMRSRSSWELTRSHFYAYSEAAVYAVSVNSGRSAVAATEIDSRGVDHGGAVARTPSGAVSLHKGQLLRVVGSVADTVVEATPFVDAVWDNAGNRLWLLDGLGNLQMRDSSLCRRVAIPSPAQFAAIHSADNRLWLEDVDELYRISTPGERNPRETQPIVWRAVTAVPSGLRVCGLILEMGAGDFFGTVTLEGRAAPGDSSQSRTMMRLAVKGPLVRPLVRRFAAPFRPIVAIEINATVSPDFMLRRVALIVEPSLKKR